jgi:hypothetical protein
MKFIIKKILLLGMLAVMMSCASISSDDSSDERSKRMLDRSDRFRSF